MKITFISIGGIKKGYVKEGFEDYLKRINRYVPALSVEVKEEKGVGAGARDAALKKEAGRVFKAAGPGSFKVVADERGSRFTSVEFSAFISDLMDRGCKDLVFIVGGPYGLDPGLTGATDKMISLSTMTLPHELARLVLAEQVFRAFTIIRGEPYSH